MAPYPYLVKVCQLHSATEVLLARDVKPASILKRLGIPPSVFLNPDAWIPNRMSLALSYEAARATGDPLYALHAGEQFRFERTGAWGESILKASTLRAAFAACIHNSGLCHSDLVLRLHAEGRKARFTHQMLGYGPDDARPYYEAASVVLQKITASTGEQARFTVWMTHSRPRGASEFERVLGPSLKFNAPENALVFDRDLLDLPLRHGATALPTPPPIKWASADPVARATLSAISERIEYESPSIQGTAAALGLQVRTLQRHLDRWGTTFEALLDDFRRERALTFLQNDTRTITEIAFRLGYSDAAHFTRAFRRWTGVPPREYLLRAHRRDHEAPQPGTTTTNATAA